MILSSLDYAKLACKTLMSAENEKALFSENRGFNYHNGVFLSGMQRVYNICGEKKYFDYVKKWVDNFIDDNGELHKARINQLDDLQPASLLFDLYKQTNDKRYIKVLDMVVSLYKKWKTNEFGGFWHKDIFPNQMWLDSLYMACPTIVRYGAEFNKEECFDLAYLQMKLMWDNMRDNRTGLLYHCWDSSKKAEWADTKTGLAPEFWGRSLGWYVLTVFDLASYMPDSYKHKQEFINNGIDLIKSILSYRDERTKKWFQIVNRGNDEKNWIETSCSCLYSYAIAKGINEGYLDDSFIEIVRECYEGIIKDIKIENNEIIIDDICIGTGVMSYDKYLERPREINDLHGMGAFVLMCSEYSILEKRGYRNDFQR